MEVISHLLYGLRDFITNLQVVTSLSAEDFGKWEATNFEPEAEFLDMLKAIDGVSVIETQTYTVS